MTSRIAVVATGLALFVGACADSSGRVGGVDKTTVNGPHGERLTIVKPRNVHLKRGEAETLTLHLSRHNMSNEVRVTVTQLPQGVEAVDTPRTTTSDSVEVVLRAGPNANLVKNHQALVTAEGPEGIRATETMQLEVSER